MLRAPVLVRQPSRQMQAANAGRQSVMVVAKKAQTADFRKLSKKEIEGKVQELQANLFKLRLSQAQQTSFKAHEFKQTRRDIARLLTVRREQEIAEGIDKRTSRKIARKEMREALNAPYTVEYVEPAQ